MKLRKKSKFYKKNPRTKLEIKKIKIEVEIPINQRTSLKLCTTSVSFKGRREKREGNKTMSQTKNYVTTDHMHYFKRKRT
jgi:hypothetical protein